MQLQLFVLACTAGAFVRATNPLMALGTPSLQVLQFSYDTVIEEDQDGGCSYTITSKFHHEESFPHGNNETCKVDVEADDGQDYFAHRWYYQRYDYATRLASGFDHVSIDWNACGHPGFGFQTPHYDLHMYTVSPEFRATQMKCDKIYGTPVCKAQNEQTGTGRGYYVFGQVASTRQLDNLPEGYEWDTHAAVEFMGTHGGHPDTVPDHPKNWDVPLLYFTTFNGAITAFEPMFPNSYNSGSEYQFHEEHVHYEVQTLATLPTYYSLEYDPDTGFTTAVMKGKSSICKEDFAEARLNGEPGVADPDSPQTSAGFRLGFAGVSALLTGIFISLLL